MTKAVNPSRLDMNLKGGYHYIFLGMQEITIAPQAIFYLENMVWAGKKGVLRMKLLCAADLHLGRRSCLSGDIQHGLDEALFSCSTGWRRLVDLALREQVDALLLAGDIVDKANRFYEAFGPLERGISELSSDGVTVYAIAGNHDWESMDRFLGLSQSGLRFQLLGSSGRWEEVIHEGENGDKLRILGWSFPDRHYLQNPLQSLDHRHQDAIPTLGIVHGEPGQRQGRYAPIALDNISSMGADMWVIGHNHNPRLTDMGAVKILVPGSLQAMDPTETGSHGAWIVEMTPGATPIVQQLSISPVRYERLTVDVSGKDPFELEIHLLEGVCELGEQVASSQAHQVLSLRVDVTGATQERQAVERMAAELQGLTRKMNGLTVIVERVTTQLRPAVDLLQLAKDDSLPGALATLILDLQDPDSAVPRDLLRDAMRSLTDVHNASCYSELKESKTLAPAEAKALLAEKATCLLDELLSQKEEA